MNTDTPETNRELRASNGNLSHHLVALCRKLERERNMFKRHYERLIEREAERDKNFGSMMSD